MCGHMLYREGPGREGQQQTTDVRPRTWGCYSRTCMPDLLAKGLRFRKLRLSGLGGGWSEASGLEGSHPGTLAKPQWLGNPAS